MDCARPHCFAVRVHLSVRDIDEWCMMSGVLMSGV